jgi:NADPH:quinone reductase-like Zn-dependent oxidoreductase
LGADHVIDYTKEDFTRSDQRYDLVYDNVNNHSMAQRRRILAPGGICVLAGIGSAGVHEGQMWRIVRISAAGFFSRFIDHKFKGYTTKSSVADLKFLSDLIAEGKVTPFVEKTYTMAETPEALRYFDEGHARGKLVIKIDDSLASRSELIAHEYALATGFWTADMVRTSGRMREVNR